MRRMDTETRYKEWIGKVTENAVEKALQLHSTFFIPNVLETWGENDEKCNLASFICSPLSRRTFTRSKGWDFEVSSLDRSNMTASIYALLVEWRPDTSVQWACKVGTTVPIFEEALYQKANTVEEYKNMALLDVHLRQVLRQFEKGNGLSYFCQKPPESCPAIDRSKDHGRSLAAKAKSVRTCKTVHNQSDTFNVAKQIKDQTPMDNPLIRDDGLQKLPESTLLKENQKAVRQNQELVKTEADQVLWETICTGNLKQMEETLVRFQNYASKKLVKRMAALISLKKREDQLIRRLALQKGSEELVTQKIKVFPIKSEEASEDESNLQVGADDLQHILTERSKNVEKICSKQQIQNPAARMAPLVEAACLEGSSSAKNSCASQSDSESNPSTLRCAQPSNCETDFTELGSNSEIFRELDPQQTEADSNACIRMPETLDDLPMCSEMPVLPKVDFQNLDSPRHADAACLTTPSKCASDQSMSESGSDLNNLRESRSPHHQEHQDLMPLGCLFQLDDDEELASCPQVDLAIHRPPIPSSNAGCSQELLQRNRQQVGLDQISHTGSSIIGDAVLRMQTDSVRVSLFSLLRESDNIEDRVSLMSLLDERDDCKLLIFDQDILSSINNSFSQSDDRNELSESHAVCCVCMAGPRGAAFVPCGHTFCRKCAYELQLARGACPLCNKGIRQILKLY